MLISRLPGDLCLTFANTLFWRGRSPASETLHGFPQLLGWMKGTAGVAGLDGATGWSRRHPLKAKQVLAEAIQVRESLYGIFSGLAEQAPLRRNEIVKLQAALTGAPARDTLIRSGDGFGWSIDRMPMTAPVLLAPVLWSAADLLVGDLRYAVRRCANDECRWLFMDRSKAGTRRWCDMASCGNRAKARRHYTRTKHVHAVPS